MSTAAQYWLFIFAFLSVNLFAQQSRIDSVRQQIPLLKGKEKVDAVNSLTRGIMYTTRDQAMDLTKEAIRLSDEIDYQQGKVMAWINQGVIFNGKALYQEAISVLNKARSASQSIDYQYGLAYADLSLVTIYTKEGNYDKAIELAFSGIAAARSINNADLEVSILLNIASIKIILKDYASAETFLLDALKLAEAHSEIPVIRLGQTYGNLGIVYSKNKDFGSAIDYFKKAQDIFESIDSKAQIANVKVNIGYAYGQLGDLENATQYYNEAEELSTELDDPRRLAIILKLRGELMIGIGDFNSAIGYLKNGLKKEGVLAPTLKSEIYALLSKANESLFQYDKAFQYYKQHAALNDSLTNVSNKVNIQRMTNQFEFETMKRNQEIELQQVEFENLKVVKSRQVIFVVAIILLLLVIWSMWNRNKLRMELVIKEKEKLLAQQEITLRQHDYESEKERLVAHAKELLARNDTLEKNADALTEKMEAGQTSNSEIDDLISKMQNVVNGDRDWAAFVIYFEAVYPHFFTLIETKKQIQLTSSEQRLLALLKINLTNKEIAAFLNISSDSVIRAKYRIKQKFGFVEAKEMLDFLSNLD